MNNADVINQMICKGDPCCNNNMFNSVVTGIIISILHPHIFFVKAIIFVNLKGKILIEIFLSEIMLWSNNYNNSCMSNMNI